MATLPDVLKKAVLEGDWNLVCKAYTAITHEPLEPPKPKINYATLEVSLGQDTPQEKPKWTNKFVDDFTLHPDERVTEHPELGVQHAVERDCRIDNDTGVKVDVECSLCGKQESVAPIHSHGYNKNKAENTYKCNDCCCGLRSS